MLTNARVVIRTAEPKDLVHMVKILNPFIQNTAVTFDTETYTEKTRKHWFEQFKLTGRYRCLIADYEGKVIGYANSAPLRPKAAYNTSVEVSIYRAADIDIPGVGSLLYAALFEILENEDVHRAHAVITLPNEASINIHKKFNFYEVGTLTEAGRKFDEYHDVYWMEKKF